MNGRVFDPELGRFLSPDPLIQAPYNTQSYNRYSYVFNNPLSFTDPSGYQTCPYDKDGCTEEVIVNGPSKEEQRRERIEAQREALRQLEIEHHRRHSSVYDPLKVPMQALMHGGMPLPHFSSPQEMMEYHLEVAEGQVVGITLYIGGELVLVKISSLAMSSARLQKLIGVLTTRFGTNPVLRQFGRSLDDLAASANSPINKEGLTAAARALSKHASGQRATGTFPKLSGGIAEQNRTAQQIVNIILRDPKSVFTNLKRGGLEVRAPDGRGLRYNADGGFSGFLDPRL